MQNKKYRVYYYVILFADVYFVFVTRTSFRMENAVVTESMARSTDKIIIVIKISGFEFLFIISLR